MSGSGSFTRKRIRVSFVRPGRPFATGANTLTFDGLRCMARISDATGVYQGMLDLMLWGLTFQHLADLFFTSGPPFVMPAGSMRVRVEAGAGDSLALVFDGYVLECQADFNAMPDVALHVVSTAAYQAAMAPIGARSYTGSIPAATILGDIAAAAGLTLRNTGVAGKSLTDQALDGTALDQIATVAGAAGISWTIEATNLIIWPADTGRPVSSVTLGPSTGLIGYPLYTQGRVMLRSQFEPRLTLGMPVEVQSSLPYAAGRWNVVAFSHAIDAEVPNGAWQTEIIVMKLGAGT